MSSLFNYIIFLIPLAIFIGRIVVQARSKNEPPPRIPIHFEDDEEEEEKLVVRKVPVQEQKSRNDDEYFPYALSRGSTEYFRGMSQANAPPEKPAHQARAAQSLLPDSQSRVVTPAVNRESTLSSAPGQKNPNLNLNHLSQLKQAVVMAEVLGPPKGMI
jgi:hypothetical protein